jgi:hypothetical protein
MYIVLKTLLWIAHAADITGTNRPDSEEQIQLVNEIYLQYQISIHSCDTRNNFTFREIRHTSTTVVTQPTAYSSHLL